MLAIVKIFEASSPQKLPQQIVREKVRYASVRSRSRESATQQIPRPWRCSTELDVLFYGTRKNQDEDLARLVGRSRRCCCRDDFDSFTREGEAYVARRCLHLPLSKWIDLSLVNHTAYFSGAVSLAYAIRSMDPRRPRSKRTCCFFPTP